MSDRPKLKATPLPWWSPAEKLLLGLHLGWWGFSFDGMLVQPGVWKIDSGPSLFGFGMTGGFLFPPSS
ncbi:hypothetical protein RchiOBHm_Chr2g0141881 [Rosa chinensis]|uniref:Uncharacterized protein n=1 Tax=Rosa chinensis TaxID=74649 RepID=A0A2P6RXQ3_ROSCH|nr:hypothetical protein RchiOBHm_Chr2g0141881 [Rosa chinensis]